METLPATAVQLPALRQFNGASLQKYLDKALAVLDKFGLTKGSAETNELGVLLEDLRDIDENRVLAVANVVQYNSSFNQLVRDKLGAIRPSDRYTQINEDFDGVRKESKALLEQLADGRLSWFEKMRNRVVAAKDGDIPARFERIKSTFKEVTGETRNRLDQVDAICEGYQDFRVALLHAKMYAYEVREVQAVRLESAKKALDVATGAIGLASSDAEKTEKEIARNEAHRAWDSEDRKYRLINTIAQELEIGYTATDTIMQKVAQTRQLDEALYQKAVVFFRANESTLTALAVAYEQQRGMQEQTASMDAMVQGTKKALEDLATTSSGIEDKAMELAYGVTIDAKSIKTLMDNVVSFQENLRANVEKYGAEAEANVAEVRKIYDDGMRRLNAAIQGYKAPEVKPAA